MGIIIDISQYQTSIDYEVAAKAVDMAILRASIGATQDAMYETYAGGFALRGVPFGAYHYLTATSEAKAVMDAKKFYGIAHSLGAAFFAVDVEDPATIPYAAAWIRALRDAGAQRIGMYTYEPWLRSLAQARSQIDFLWLSLAMYTGNMPCDLYQYAVAEGVPGCKGAIDHDRLMGDKTIEWFTEQKRSDIAIAKPNATSGYITNALCNLRALPSQTEGTIYTQVEKGTHLAAIGHRDVVIGEYRMVEYDRKTCWAHVNIAKNVEAPPQRDLGGASL